MSMWDWVQAGLGRHNKSVAAYKGSYKVNVGTALSAYFGGRHTHIFGPEIKLVADPEEVLAHLLPQTFTALASGLTSNATFVYGSSTSATYIGPKVDIQRAPKMSRVSLKFTTRPGTGAGGTWTESPGEQDDPLDKASARAVAVLSLLAIAAAASFEMAMHIHYRQFTDSTKGPGPDPKLMATASYAIPSRLFAIIKIVETTACYGSWGEGSLARAGDVAVWNATYVACRNQIRSIKATYLEWQAQRVREAEEAASRLHEGLQADE